MLKRANHLRGSFPKLHLWPQGVRRFGDLAVVLALVASSASAAELDCEIIGTQYAEWQGNDYQLSQSKAYQRVHKLAFVTGEQPKIAYLRRQTADWVWQDLEAVPTQNGVIYSAVLAAGGVLSVVLNDDETRIVVNYVGRADTSEVDAAIYSTSGVGQCFPR